MQVKNTISEENFKTLVYIISKDDAPALAALPLGSFLTALVEENKNFSKLGHVTSSYYGREQKLQRIIIVGAGDLAQEGANAVRKAAGTVARFLLAAKISGPVAVCTGFTQTQELFQAMVEGLNLGSYSYTECKGKQEELNSCSFTLSSPLQNAPALLAETKVLTKNICLVRDWVNKPGNILYPEVLAQLAKKFSKKLSLSCEILDKKAMTKKKMGAILAVGQGSDHEPRMITVKYQGAGKEKPYLAFVGKGVTFDSGGISLKPAAGMGDMKDDMAGAAAVLGAVKTIAELKLPINVMAVAGCVENLPSGTAFKPGDVVTSASGKTIEIVNTDAEGRVVLADAVWYAGEQGATKIIDLATLTGACLIALGMETAGIITNNEELAQHIIKCGKAAGENYWILPSLPDVRKLLESNTGDVRNETGRWGGTISAGLFIEEFVKPGLAWAHLDIAGPANTEKPRAFYPQGATGFGVATLVNLAKEL